MRTMRRWAFVLMLVLAGCDAGDLQTDAGGKDAGEEPDAAARSCPAGSARIEPRCDPELVPCGGAISGEHCYSEVCFEKDELLTEALMQPGIPDGCTSDVVELRGSTGTIEGSIRFSATDVTRSVTSTVTGTFWLPAACQLVAGDCDVLESFLNGALAPSGWAACEVDGEGCECDLALEAEADDTSSYTIEGNTIVTGSGLRFDYCVESEGLRFRQGAASGGASGIATVRPAER